jgi:heptaprenyl diphosphate synthase
MTSLVWQQELNLSPVLQKVERQILEITAGHNKTLGALAARIIQAGGKRLRPLLVLLSGWKEQTDWEPLVDVAVAAELIHTASLIHDDIVDDAEKRRGLPTINSTRGNHTAVLTGDYLFARAFSLLSGRRSRRALPFMVEAIEAMCEGAIEEMATLFDHTQTEEDYLSRIYKKTASLVEACCGAGAEVGGAPPEVVRARKEFGRNLGLAFQIVDDLLDFSADEQTLGKPAGSDLVQGILTLPVIYLLQNPQCGGSIREIIAGRRCTPADFAYVKKAALETAALRRAYLKAREFQEKALACLCSLPPGPLRSAFERIAELVTTRKS